MMPRFGQEQVQELIATLSANKLRTLLTGFAVGWGVLILVLLLSSGMGIANGIRKTAADLGLSSAKASLDVGFVSIPTNGHREWEDIKLTRAMVQQFQAANPQDILLAAPTKTCYSLDIGYGGKSSKVTVVGVVPEYMQVESIRFNSNEGRPISPKDEREGTKVVVLQDIVAKSLFRSSSEAIGKYVIIEQIAFKVIGVHKSKFVGWKKCYIPLKTLETLHLGENKGYNPLYISNVSMLCPKLQTQEDCDVLLGKLRKQLASMLGTDPQDKQVLFLTSTQVKNKTISYVILGLDAFLWLIGLSTLLIGLIGVVTIMQVTITERKREIGIRKALGAKPQDIIVMILSESVVITMVSGLIGLMSGVGLMSLVIYYMEHVQEEKTYSQFFNPGTLFLDPMISLEMALGAIAVMVLGGLVAGYIPARKAIRIPVVEAMH